MPLKSGSSQKVISSNIREFHGGETYAKTAAKFGKKKADKQAVAIALSKAREGRADGGAVPMREGAPIGVAYEEAARPPSKHLELSAALTGLAGGPGMAMGGVAPYSDAPAGGKLTLGPILSDVPGRTDAHATQVPSGSYVIPADIVSGRGQGNTIAGAKLLEKLFKMGPFGTKLPGMRKGSMPRISTRTTKTVGLAEGGPVAEETPEPVRVNLAGGEIVVPPENLTEVVHPDLKTAHEIMDAWVLNERKMLRKTLAKLPGPVKD